MSEYLHVYMFTWVYWVPVVVTGIFFKKLEQEGTIHEYFLHFVVKTRFSIPAVCQNNY